MAEGNVRPMRRDAQRNGELVLQAARDVLAEFGTVAGMEQIATRAGVGVGTVYRHYPSKEALIDELVRLMLDRLVVAAENEFARGDGTGLEAFLRVLGGIMVEHHGYMERLVERPKTARSTVLRGLIGDLLAQAQRAGRIGPDVVIGDIVTVTWALRGVIAASGAVAPDAWERYLDIHLAGLRIAAAATDRPGLTATQLARITHNGQS